MPRHAGRPQDRHPQPGAREGQGGQGKELLPRRPPRHLHVPAAPRVRVHLIHPGAFPEPGAPQGHPPAHAALRTRVHVAGGLRGAGLRAAAAGRGVEGRPVAPAAEGEEQAVDALPDELLPEAAGRGEQPRAVLLLRGELLLPVPAAQERGVLGEEDRLRVPRADGDPQALHQDRLLQPRLQAADGHLLLQTHELHRPRRLLRRWMILNNPEHATITSSIYHISTTAYSCFHF